MVAPIYIPTNSAQVSLFSTSSPILVICCLLCDTHSNRNKVISYCGFICISLMISDVQYIYMYQLATWMSPFKKCLFSSSAHYLTRFFVVLLLSYMSSLYILDINHLSDRWFANIFFHYVGCLFILFILLCRSFLVWCSPTCWYFLLLFVLLVSYTKHHHQDQHLGAFPLCFLLAVL